MTLVLQSVPGLSDLSAVPLAADKPAIGIHLNRININANFGIVRLEVFSGTYQHGDTIPVPVSDVDGYTYSRSELIYIWQAQNTGDPSTGWATYQAPWTMWYGVWNVNQNTGEVESIVGYRGNQDHTDRQAQTNDGVLQVFIIAQRQRTGLSLAAVPSFSNILAASFYTDRPLHTDLITEMNDNAKFSIVNTEVFYLGELAHGGTVALPTSPIDGHVYSSGEVSILTSFRWTSDTANGGPVVPAISKGQLQDWAAAVTFGGGHYTAALTIDYESGGRHAYNEGKVAVFAICQRSGAGTFPVVEDSYAEITQDRFFPGTTLRASTLNQLNRNTKQAVLTPEFFGPTDHSNGDTIAVPTSPVDGYTYDRAELFYLWDIKQTGPSTGTGDRMALWQAGVSNLGVVTINDYRLGDGASTSNLAHEGQIRVIIYAKRAIHPVHPPLVPVHQPTDPIAPDIIPDQLVNGVVLNTPGGSTAGDNADTVITWPVAFPDALYAIKSMVIVSDNGYGYISVFAQTATDVTVRLWNYGGGVAAISINISSGY